VTAKARVLLLPFVAFGLLAIVLAVFYIWSRCGTDGRESLGDKTEWSILQVLEDRHRNSPILALEFSETEGHHILCVPSVGKRVWIMLDPRNPPFYKQLPHDSYSLSREQYDKIISSRHATSTVEEVLASHVQ
jgi:hypothetical protein